MNRPRRNPPVIVANEMEMIDSDDDSVSEPVLSMASKRSTGSTKPSLKRLVKSNSSIKYEEDEDENDSEEVEPDAGEDDDEEDHEDEFENEMEDGKNQKGYAAKSQVLDSKKRKGTDEGNSLDRFGFSAVAKTEKHHTQKRDINVDVGKTRALPPSRSSRSSSRVTISSKKTEIAEDSPTEESRRAKKTRVSKRNKADDDSDFDEVDIKVRKSSRTRQFSKDYADPHSDDEFAVDGATVSSREGRVQPKKIPSKSQVPKAVKKRKNESGSDASNDDQVLSVEDSKSGSNEENNGDDNDSAEEVTKGDSEDEEYGEEDDDDDESSGVEKCSDDIDYKIQHVLARQSMTPTKWREICGTMNTREVIRGSVLQQPDSEFNDPTKKCVEKYLIKWLHASYLHVSWETEKDIIDLVGFMAKSQIRKFKEREIEGPELFEDLTTGEYFPVDLITVSRILNVDDDDVDVLTIDWVNTPLPSSFPTSSSSIVASVSTDSSRVRSGEDGWDGVDSITPSNKRNANKKNITPELKPSDQHIKNAYLHGSACWVVVKWEGSAYGEASFEDINDLMNHCSVNATGRNAPKSSSTTTDATTNSEEQSAAKPNDIVEYSGIEYEQALRDFYRREQRVPSKIYGQGQKRYNRSLKTCALSAPAPAAFHSADDFRLRDYQWDGVRWILFNWSQKRNCILADEMGLGKTIQTAGFLQFLNEHQNVSGPFLIVAPLSTVVNWHREMLTWTDMDAVLYQGSQKDREDIRKYEFGYMSRENAKGHKMQIVITSPETCMVPDKKSVNGRGLCRALSAIQWDVIVVDEAHKLKNYDSKLSYTLRNEYSYQNCLLLTGTPLQNNTDELWTLLNFVDREEFKDREKFIEEFGDLKSAAQLERLHKNLKPYVLRREKEHVEKSVPPKEEVIIDVELTVPQKQYYRAIYEQNTAFLYKGNPKDGPRLTNLAMELRKCCNHPYLVKGAEAEIAKHFVDDSPLEVMVKSSGKLTLLDKLLPKLKADGHRVLIFSQFRIMLNIIEDYLNLRGYTYERIDGAVTGKKRQCAIDRYQNPVTGAYVMLLSTRAGGVGINLTAADTVIIFDSDWNPQNDLQAQARAHRIGQTKPVKVYRLLTRKTYETMMFKAASIKLGLDYAVMHNMHGQGGTAAVAGVTADRVEHVSALSKKELENLLRHGAYDIFREEKEGQSVEESNKFCEADIDQILSRSSTIVHDGKKSGALSASAASFSKASFVASGGATDDVAIDDPDFWTKVVGLAGGVDGLEDDVVRKRKCRDVFTSYKEPASVKISKKMASDTSSASDRDSDNDDDQSNSDEENKGGINEDANKRRKVDRRSSGGGKVDWKESHISRVLATMLCSSGYGNWEQLRGKVNLPKWPLPEIARAARVALLQLLQVASLQTTVLPGSPEDAAKASKAGIIRPNVTGPISRDSPAAADTPSSNSVTNGPANGSATGVSTVVIASGTGASNMSTHGQRTTAQDLYLQQLQLQRLQQQQQQPIQQHIRVSEDHAYLETFLSRNRACRLALAALERDPFTPHSGPPRNGSGPPRLRHSVAPENMPIAEDYLFNLAVQTAVSGSSNGKLQLPILLSAKISGNDVLAGSHFFPSVEKLRLLGIARLNAANDATNKSAVKSERTEDAFVLTPAAATTPLKGAVTTMSESSSKSSGKGNAEVVTDEKVTTDNTISSVKSESTDIKVEGSPITAGTPRRKHPVNVIIPKDPGLLDPIPTPVDPVPKPIETGPLELFNIPFGTAYALRECGLVVPPVFSMAHSVSDKGNILRQRNLARQRLQQLEDLFEDRLASCTALALAESLHRSPPIPLPLPLPTLPLSTANSSSSSRSSASSSSEVTISNVDTKIENTLTLPATPTPSRPAPSVIRHLAHKLLAAAMRDSTSRALRIVKMDQPRHATPMPLKTMAAVTGEITSTAAGGGGDGVGAFPHTTQQRTPAYVIPTNGASSALVPLISPTIHPSTLTTTLALVPTHLPTPLPAHAPLPVPLQSPLDEYRQWTSEHDALTVFAAYKNGWPSGEQRIHQFEDYFRLNNFSLDMEYSHLKYIQTEGSAVQKMDTTRDETKCLHVYPALLTGRVFVKRMREISAALRTIPEPEVPIVAGYTAVPPVGRPKNKSAPRLGSVVLRTVLRWGRPRDFYDDLGALLKREKAVKDAVIDAGGEGEKEVCRSVYLLYWRNFAIACGFKVDGNGEVTTGGLVVAEDVVTIESIKEAINFFLKLLQCAVSGTNAAELMQQNEDGHMHGLSLRMVETAFDKSDIIHKARMTLACHTDAELMNCFKRNCKGAGPSCPTARRDAYLPVWWTAHHDISLLKEIHTMGVGLQQWKFIAEDSSLSFPPHDFIIPPKAMGVEWVVTTNPKVLEKRCFTLILAACCMSVSPERIVPGSEEDPFYVTKRRAAASQLFRTAAPSVPTALPPIIPHPAVLTPANTTDKLTENGLASISGSGVVGSVGVKAEPQASPSTLVISSLPSISQPSSSSSSIKAVIAAIPSTSSTSSSSTSSSSSAVSSSATPNKTTAASKQKTKSPSKVKSASKASIHASLKKDRQKMKLGQAVRRCAPRFVKASGESCDEDEGEGDLYNEDVSGSESDSSSSCPLVASKEKKEKERKKAKKEAEKEKVEKNETVGQSSPSRDTSSTPLLTPNRKHPRTPPTVKSDLNTLDLTHDENENENKNEIGNQNKRGSQNGSNKMSRRSISVSSNYISPPEESNTGFAMNRDSTLPTPLILSPEGPSRSSQREKNRKAAEQLAAINAANKKKEVALKANKEVKRKKETVAVDLTCDSAEEDFEEEKENERDDGIDQPTAATDSKTSHKRNGVKSVSIGMKVDPSSAPVGTSDVKGKESTISSSLSKSPGKGREGKVTEGITAGSSTTVSTTNSSSSSTASVPNVPHVSAVTGAGAASIATTGVTAKTGKRGRPPAATAAASAVSRVATKATTAKAGIKSFFSAK